MTTTNVTIQVPEQNQLLSEAAAAQNTASLIIIQNESDLQFATEQMNGMSKRVKELDTLRKSITSPLDAAKKNVMALFKPVTNNYQISIGKIKSEIAKYTVQKEREAAEARAKAELEAQQTRKALEEKAKEAETPEQAEALQEAAALVTAEPVAKIEKTKGLESKGHRRAGFPRLCSNASRTCTVRRDQCPCHREICHCNRRHDHHSGH